MILLAPLALWLSLLGAGVVALYLLKVKRERVLVPSLEFWQALVGQKQTRTLFQRLKRWISLMLWLLILAIIILSIANPVLTLGKIKPRSIVVVIDNSASMQAIEQEKSRLELAVSELERLTTGRPVRDEWLLIEAGRDVRVLQGWTHRHSAILDAADTIEPHHGETQLGESLSLATQLIEGRDDQTIVLLSDGSSAQGYAGHLEDDRIIHIPVGEEDDNVGITRISVLPSRLQANQHVYVRVESCSSQFVECNLIAEVDGVTVEVLPIELEPGGEVWEQTLVFDEPEGGDLRVSIDRADILDADNEAFAIMPPITAAKVALVSDQLEAFFFEQALSAMVPLIDPAGSTTISDTEIDSIDWAQSPADIVIFNTESMPSSVNAEAVVSINGIPEWTGARVIGEVVNPRLVIHDPDHPLVRYLDFAGSSIVRAKKIDLVRSAEVLVTSEAGDPLVFLSREAGRDTLCFAFDVFETDLPFRNAFPIMLRNAVGYLIEEQTQPMPEQVRVGEVVRPKRFIDQDSVSAVTSEDGEERATELKVEQGSFEYQDTGRPRTVRFDLGGDTGYTAINISSASETLLNPVSLRGDTSTLEASSTLLSRPPWVILTIIAVILVVFEWSSFHLRWTE